MNNVSLLTRSQQSLSLNRTERFLTQRNSKDCKYFVCGHGVYCEWGVWTQKRYEDCRTPPQWLIMKGTNGISGVGFY